MAITASSTSDGVRIEISGRFDFSQNDAFRRAYQDTPAGSRFAIDLKRVSYVDSSALGMLLLLRRHAGDRIDSVSMQNIPADVGRVLRIARFDQLFTFAVG